jgi:predicted phosphohydrolase
MKILYTSDLHLEFRRSLKYNVPDHDICIIAGDLSDSNNFQFSLDFISHEFNEIIYVHGNHDFYHSSLKGFKNNIRIPYNISILENEFKEVKNQRFFGGTLWFPKEDDPRLRKLIGDFSYIKDINNIYYSNNKFKEMLSNVNSNDIIISHHLPSYKSVADKFN